jgi:predicted RNA-binding protein YlxR (DUF448 family)
MIGATPQRTCVGCRRVATPAELTRVARGVDGRAAVGRHRPGRGAWLCAGSPACFESAVRRRALARALRTELSTADIEELRGRLTCPSGAPGATGDGRGEMTMG